MVRIACVVLSVLLLPLSASAQSVGIGLSGGESAATQEAVQMALDELRALDDLIDAADSRSVQRELHRKVARIQELLRDASHHAGHSGGGLSASVVINDHQPAPETIVIVDGGHDPTPLVIIDDGPSACSDGDFRSVVRAVEDESFSSGKIGVLRDASRARWFTVHQVKQLMEQFTFGKDMVEAGAILHGRTVDLENWYQVYSVFTFDSDKDALRDRVE